jgi:hypothetical protein
MSEELLPCFCGGLLETRLELERLVRDPTTLGFLEIELRIPLLGFPTLSREFALEGETTFAVPKVVTLDFENLEV